MKKQTKNNSILGMHRKDFFKKSDLLVKRSSISSYPKIFHLGENFIANLFKGKVEISEKIDGSLWAFGINENAELVFRSKGEDLTYKGVHKMFEKAKEQTDRIFKILKKNKLKDIYFYCEFLNKPKHNILQYKKTPKNNLYLFAVKKGKNFVSSSKTLHKYADLLKIEKVNILYENEVKNVKKLEKILENDSILGNEKIEGIVIKNYVEPSMKGDQIFFNMSMGKYVREDFKERHSKEWKGSHTGKGKFELFVESFKSEARWHKGIQHAKELNKLTNSPKDIGMLIKMIHEDIEIEEKENIKNEMYKMFINDILRRSTRGFPEFYKEILLKKSVKK